MWKLLRTHISKGQLTGFSLANLAGLAIVIMTVQFYQDVLPLFSDHESFISKDYLIVTRNITSAGAMLGGSSEFSEQAIGDLELQPWCRRVGRFTSSTFSVEANFGSQGRAMHTRFFFESIPSEFIDVSPDRWGFSPQQPTVPVILARDYLNLYNFGFAATQGLPQISEGQAGSLPITFTFAGGRGSQMMPGRLVGFSNRLNTIIVPDSFMKWANQKFGDGSHKQPLRLIVEVNRPGDPKIQEYMDAHNYNVAGDKTNSGKAYYFLTLVTSIVIVIGALISALSFFVLMLSIYLLLQKNSKKLQDLLLLGYSPAEVSLPYRQMVVAINCIVLLLAVGAMLLARMAWMPTLHSLGTGGGTVTAAIATAVVIMAGITAGNLMAIGRKVQNLWLHE